MPQIASTNMCSVVSEAFTIRILVMPIGVRNFWCIAPAQLHACGERVRIMSHWSNNIFYYFKWFIKLNDDLIFFWHDLEDHIVPCILLRFWASNCLKKVWLERHQLWTFFVPSFRGFSKASIISTRASQSFMSGIGSSFTISSWE